MFYKHPNNSVKLMINIQLMQYFIVTSQILSFLNDGTLILKSVNLDSIVAGFPSFLQASNKLNFINIVTLSQPY